MVEKNKVVVKGIKSLQQILEHGRSRFASAPILLIESRPEVESNRVRSVEEACRHVNFLFSRQMGFRTIASHSVSGYVFPTHSDVQHATDLAARVGASTVVAVGSGSAMDLALAVVQSSRHELEELIFVPATYGAILASASSHALLLDPAEEALLPHPASRAIRKIPKTIAVMEQNMFDTRQRREACYTAFALAFDVIYQGRSSVEKLANVLDGAIASLNTTTVEGTAHEILSEILLETGESVSFGLQNDNRSIPLALAASLIPKVFSQYDAITFLASFAPALFLALEGNGTLAGRIAAHTLDGAPRLVTTESVEILLSHVHANQALRKALDAPDEVFRAALRDHVLV